MNDDNMRYNKLIELNDKKSDMELIELNNSVSYSGYIKYWEKNIPKNSVFYVIAPKSIPNAADISEVMTEKIFKDNVKYIYFVYKETSCKYIKDIAKKISNVVQESPDYSQNKDEVKEKIGEHIKINFIKHTMLWKFFDKSERWMLKDKTGYRVILDTEGKTQAVFKIQLNNDVNDILVEYLNKYKSIPIWYFGDDGKLEKNFKNLIDIIYKHHVFKIIAIVASVITIVVAIIAE